MKASFAAYCVQVHLLLSAHVNAHTLRNVALGGLDVGFFQESELHVRQRHEKFQHAHHVRAELLQEEVTSGHADLAERLPLVPYPAFVRHGRVGSRPFLLHVDTPVVVGHGVPATDVSVTLLQQHLQEIGNSGRGDSSSARAAIKLEVNASTGEPESYHLHVGKRGIVLIASDLAGMFYGIQTLKQLTPSTGAPELPAVTIRDKPRLQWRGLMLDVSRHFFNATEVKKLLNTMAAFKLNHFHWHLSDDQGWRLPVKDYPKLTEVGARGVDGQIHAYTMQEIKDVIRYAQERHITVIPEVDVPGHSGAAIAAYPDLGNTDIPEYSPPSEPYHKWGVHEYTLSPTEHTLDFLSGVYNEIADVFPGPFVHIGGDEAPADQWRKSKHARDLDLPQTQSFFNAALGILMTRRNKTVLAWDEAQHMEGLPKDSIVVAWRSLNELYTAVSHGRRVVNADLSTLYFDHYQGEEWEEPKAICCYTPLQSVYNYDPLPSHLSGEEKKLVLGAQAQLWAEYFPTFKQVEYMAFPRSLAFAERLWTPRQEIKGFVEFKKRLRPRLHDLDRWGVNYRHLDGEQIAE